MSGRHARASPDCVSAGGFNAFFRAIDTAAYIVPVASCHTLSLFVPMHTLAHNVMWRHSAGRCDVRPGDRKARTSGLSAQKSNIEPPPRLDYIVGLSCQHAKFPFPRLVEDGSFNTTDIFNLEVGLLTHEWKAKKAVRAEKALEDIIESEIATSLHTYLLTK